MFERVETNRAALVNSANPQYEEILDWAKLRTYTLVREAKKQFEEDRWDAGLDEYRSDNKGGILSLTIHETNSTRNGLTGRVSRLYPDESVQSMVMDAVDVDLKESGWGWRTMSFRRGLMERTIISQEGWETNTSYLFSPAPPPRNVFDLMGEMYRISTVPSANYIKQTHLVPFLDNNYKLFRQNLQLIRNEGLWGLVRYDSMFVDVDLETNTGTQEGLFCYGSGMSENTWLTKRMIYPSDLSTIARLPAKTIMSIFEPHKRQEENAEHIFRKVFIDDIPEKISYPYLLRKFNTGERVELSELGIE